MRDERKCMSDREILEKYINLSNTCLHVEEKKEVMDMLYKYRDAFRLRDEIGTCPNIEVLRNSKCEVLLVLDLKVAFHSLWLSEDSKRYCGILLHFGSASYLYLGMPM